MEAIENVSELKVDYTYIPKLELQVRMVYTSLHDTLLPALKINSFRTSEPVV